MKKQLLILALLAAIALAPAIKPAAAAPSVVTTKWLKPVFSGTDPYHDTSVVAYEAGSTAKMLVRVYNDYASASDIQIKVLMDWMTSNVSTEEVAVEGGQYYVFEISIPIPATSAASNLYLHSYVMYFEYTTNTVPAMIREYEFDGGNNFAVYSADQADIVDVKRELDAIGFGYYSGIYMTAKARELLMNARTEESLGEQMYDKGEFASSLTNYNNALNYTRAGLSTDVEKMALIEDTVLSLMDSMKMLGYGSLLFGIGFLFIGIGVIIYSIRRPRSPA